MTPGIISVFEVVNGKLELTPDCFLKDYLAPITKRKDHLDVFTYLYYKTSIKSHYNNLPETERDAAILKDQKLKIDLSDTLILEAIERLTQDLKTPVMRDYEATKHLYATLSQHKAALTPDKIKDGQQGNFKVLSDSILNASEMASKFRALEKIAEQEITERVRGNNKRANDLDDL